MKNATVFPPSHLHWSPSRVYSPVYKKCAIHGNGIIGNINHDINPAYTHPVVILVDFIGGEAERVETAP